MTPVTLDSSARPCAASASRRSASSSADAATSSVKVRLASLGDAAFESVAVYVYVAAATGAAGEPLIVRAAASNTSPAGGAGASA